MEKCKLCERPIGEESPFTNYCSKRCERKAVDYYGEEKGRKKGIGPLILILILIFGILFIFIKKNSSDKEKMPEENQMTTIDSLSTSNQSKEETVSYENEIKNDSSILINEINENDVSLDKEINDTVTKSYSRYQQDVDKATEMLKRGKSVSEIADSTVLLKEDIRKLKRELRNNN